MVQVTHSQPQASHDDLVVRARQLVPHLQQRVKEMDQLGYLPEATVQELQDAELFQLSIPRIYGGHQVDIRTYMDVVAEIARGDTSTAWTLSIINGANWMAATIFPEETQQEVFGTEGGARVTGVLAPRQCTVQRVDGGYLIADIIIEASGGSFAAAHNPLNHFWRDIRTGTLHAFLNPTTNQELYGRLLCGQPANTPLV